MAAAVMLTQKERLISDWASVCFLQALLGVVYSGVCTLQWDIEWATNSIIYIELESGLSSLFEWERNTFNSAIFLLSFFLIQNFVCQRLMMNSQNHQTEVPGYYKFSAWSVCLIRMSQNNLHQSSSQSILRSLSTGNDDWDDCKPHLLLIRGWLFKSMSTSTSKHYRMFYQFYAS